MTLFLCYLMCRFLVIGTDTSVYCPVMLGSMVYGAWRELNYNLKSDWIKNNCAKLFSLCRCLIAKFVIRD